MSCAGGGLGILPRLESECVNILQSESDERQWLAGAAVGAMPARTVKSGIEEELSEEKTDALGLDFLARSRGWT